MIIGHEETKKQLDITIEAAVAMNSQIPHILLTGAAGCGKTTMARYIATKANRPFLSIVPNNLKDLKSVCDTITKFDHTNYDQKGNRIGIINPTILFLDEVHNLPLKGQELLGLVMERFIIEANKPNEYNWSPLFTVVGATTMAGKLSKPFRDRFKLNFSFQPYKNTEMEEIVTHHIKEMGFVATPKAIKEIAIRSRGTPRIAVGFVEHIRDAMLTKGSKIATDFLVKDVFKLLKIDDEGFNEIELRILKTLFDFGQPVSIDNLSVILQEDTKSLLSFAEPYLIRKELILVTGKGRAITEKGIQYISNSGKADKLIKETIMFDYKRV